MTDEERKVLLGVIHVAGRRWREALDEVLDRGEHIKEQFHNDRMAIDTAREALGLAKLLP